MSLTIEWRHKIEQWRKLIPTLWATPVADVSLGVHYTAGQYGPREAARLAYAPVKPGAPWGKQWEYAWLKGRVRLPAGLKGKRAVLDLDLDSRNAPGLGACEAVAYLDGRNIGGTGWAHRLLPLASPAKGGESWELLAEAYAGHGETPCGDGPVPHGQPPARPCPPAQRAWGQAKICVFHEDLFQAWIDLDTAFRLREQLDANSLRVADLDQALMDFVVAVDVEAPLDDLVRQAGAGRAALRGALACRNGSTAPGMVCFGHSHIDVAWLWPLRETESKCLRTFGTQLALMDEYPEYKYLQSQPHLYWMTKRTDPDLYRRIQEKVKKGQWLPEGGMWVEADTNVTGPESLVRQFVAGKRFYREELGVESELMWLPDVFGYSGALPQIMKGCGIRFFSTQKIYWVYNGGDPFPHVTFQWEGIDGTRLLTHLHNDYNSMVTPTHLISRWNERAQKMGFRERLFPFGWGDGGGGPTRDHMEYLRRQKDLEGCPRCRMESPVPFLRAEEKRMAGLPVYAGELYFQNHRGTYSSQSRTKRGNRLCEFALREAEWLASAALALRGAAYPSAELEGHWRQVLLNQFHDIIPGSSIGRVYREAEAGYAAVLEGCRQLSDKAARTLLPKAKGTATALNALSWARRALVELPAGALSASLPGGQALPVQTLSDGRTLAALDLPPMGAASIHLSAGRPAAAAPTPDGVTARATASGALLENGLLRAVVNNRAEITSLVDKATGRELAAGPLGQLRLWKDLPRAFDAWDIDSNYKAFPVPLDGKASIKLLDGGPLAGRLEVTRRVGGSQLRQVVSLEAGARQINFATEVDWREKHKMLKACFPFALHNRDTLHEIQFGHLARPNHANRLFDADRFEVGCQKWSALTEDNRGCAVLNDCKYGVSAEDNSINLTLLRAPVAPDGEADLGRQVFTYALYFWEGPLGEAGPVRPAYELNAPVRLVEGLAGDFTLLAVEGAPSVVVETVKKAEDGTGDIVVRFYESARRAAEGRLSLGFPAKVWAETDMLENAGKNKFTPVKNGSIPFRCRAFEIKTVRIRR